MPQSCTRQAEIVQLLALGHWPHAAAPELLTHAERCPACRDRVLLAQTFLAARAASLAAAHLPPPGVLWGRAQLRRRHAAVERLQRPILAAHLFAFAVVAVIAAVFAASEAQPSLRWLSGLAASLTSLAPPSSFHLAALAPFALLRPNLSLALAAPAAAMLAVLGGVVLYLASEKH